MSNMETTRALRSLVKADGALELSINEVQVPSPGPDEVVVRIEAAAINPSDLGTMFAGADLQQAANRRDEGRDMLVAPLAETAVRAAVARHDQSMPVGHEGAGTVVAAGSSDRAQALLGQTVGVVGAGMYAQLRCVPVDDCEPFPEATTAADGAGWYVNPLTALTMLATMREEGHSALVHTAAASSLGHMLLRLCRADDVPLVNIVRRPEQAAVLRDAGAQYVCDSSADDFRETLAEAVAATGATLAFDAIGGGALVDDILSAMERALSAGAPFNRYGSPVHKQVYTYGALDRSPTPLRRSYGMSWGVGGWLVFRRLERLGPEVTAQMRARVASELTSTFATAFGPTISLEQAVDPEVARVYARASTGGKHVLNPAA